ncbi:hypothetical protein O1611_g2769 [Lasiodiplodia mahajangana]|uniref:Uncharacterized protein n=1 Tax=Lasiodiplodia mahajangana TaxID=1108764 RepID=A0ACC2JTZ9_9PEZI|nr:hypothetical protein O1611_g2769 [Lasiodiplodia mahajangana]
MAESAINGSAGVSASLLSLGETILELTRSMAIYLEGENFPTLSFAPNAQDPPNTQEYRRLHANLKASLEDLKLLIDGPRRWLREFCCTGYDLGALQVALDFEFFQLVPTNGGITLDNLASHAGLDVDRTSRIIRQLMTYRIFEEHQPRLISHSAASLALQKDENIRSVVHYSLDEMLKAAADCNISLKANPHEAHQNLNPFVTRHGVGMFEFYKNNPDKARRFAKAMAGLREMDSHLDSLLKDGFDWSALRGTVVDCGGGNGHISKSLAVLYPELKFIVQDSNTDMLAEGSESLSHNLQGRVTYSQHSFFDPQPVAGAAAFLIRQCAHNWADKDVVTIFKSFVPGLENSSPDTPLLINDIIMPEPGKWPRHQERNVRQVDMVMLVNCGAKQRTKAEFDSLLKQADPRYEIRKVFDNGPLGLLEWDLTDLDSLNNEVQSILTGFPNLDSVYINAAIQNHHIIFEQRPDQRDVVQEMTTNLLAPVLVAQYFAQYLLKLAQSGTYTNIFLTGSSLAYFPLPFYPVYCPTKAGISAFAKVMRMQLEYTGCKKMKVVEVVPPYVDTDLNAAHWRRTDALQGGPEAAVQPLPPSEYIDGFFEGLMQTGADNSFKNEIGVGFGAQGAKVWNEGFQKLLDSSGMVDRREINLS